MITKKEIKEAEKIAECDVRVCRSEEDIWSGRMSTGRRKQRGNDGRIGTDCHKNCNFRQPPTEIKNHRENECVEDEFEVQLNQHLSIRLFWSIVLIISNYFVISKKILEPGEKKWEIKRWNGDKKSRKMKLAARTMCLPTHTERDSGIHLKLPRTFDESFEEQPGNEVVKNKDVVLSLVLFSFEDHFYKLICFILNRIWSYASHKTPRYFIISTSWCVD